MKRVSIFVVFFCFQSIFLLAQKEKVDSLINLIKHDKEDTIKVFHLHQLGRLYIHTPSLDTDYCLQAAALAKKLNYPEGIGEAYKYIGIVYWATLKDRSRGLSYLSASQKIFEKNGNMMQNALVHSLIGSLYFGMDSFNVALKYYLEGLQLSKKTKNKPVQTGLLENVAADYGELCDYPNALKYSLLALKEVEGSGDNKRIALYSGNVAKVYLQAGDTVTAMRWFDTALSMARETYYKAIQISVLLDMAGTYRFKKKYSVALAYSNQALQLSKQEVTPMDIADCLETIGEIYKDEGDYNNALEAENNALKLANENKYTPTITNCTGVIGEIYLKQKNYKEAVNYLRVAAAAARGAHAIETEKNYELDLSQLYSATNELKKSLACYARYDSLKDTLFNRDKSKEIGKVEAKAEYDKQLETQQADEDKVKADAVTKSKQQQVITLIIILIALIVTLIAVLIYRSWRTTKKEKNIIEKEKVLMELKALRAQMNPHFIFNAINSIQNFILENEQEAAQKHLSRFSKLMRMVLENSSYENIALEDEIKMLELYLEFETVRFSSQFSYRIKVDPSMDKNNVFIPPLIIQPYVENAVWHGLMHLKDRVGEVVISFELYKNQLKCIIDDNGIGRARSLEIKKDSMHESRGLSITAERLEIINTLFKSKMSVTFTDKENPDGTPAGTRVELLMPIITNQGKHA